MSICIPTYKGAAYIYEAVKSALQQSFEDVEVVVIDDCSPDDTEKIVRGIDDPRLTYVRNPRNLGPEGNWNRCLEMASGVYFKLLPQDDILLPDCVRRQVSVLESDEAQEIALVFCARTIIRPDGRRLMSRGFPSAVDCRIPASVAVRHCLRRGTNVLGEPGGVLFRKSLANRVGAFDAGIPYVLDLDYWVRLLAEGDAYYIAESLAGFRVNQGSWSVSIGRRQSEDFERFVKILASRGQFQVSTIDALIASGTARLNSILRGIVYRLVLGRA